MSADDDNPLFPPRPPEQVAAEKARLAELEERSVPGRVLGYLRLSGPGFLQSAFSLGGGSLSASLIAGALLGYALLWVQPVAMACGVVMMMAMAYQVMHAPERPLEAVNKYVHPVMGWSWAICALLASLIWVLPQYNLSVDVIADMTGTTIEGGGTLIPSVAIFAVVAAIVWNYGSSKGVRLFEWITRALIVLIIACFALVVLLTGAKLGWNAVVHGYFGFHVPTGAEGAHYPGWEATAETLVEQGKAENAAALMRGAGSRGLDLLLAAFSAAVGINMTFLFPYSIRARGWGPEHRRLAKYDLWVGMLIPFAITTSLLMIASANQFFGQVDYAGFLLGTEKPGAPMLADSLEPVTGKIVAHWVFGLGVLGMTVSSIAMMMLVSGFVVMELTKTPFGGLAYRIGTMLPAIGIFGPLVWRKYAFEIAVPTSILCLLFLPIAYASILILQNRRAYLKDAMPTGGRRIAWNLALGAALTIVVVAVVWTVRTKWPGMERILFGDEQKQERDVDADATTDEDEDAESG